MCGRDQEGGAVLPMRSLLEFLQRNLHWLVFLALEAISLRLLFAFNSYQGSVYLTTANAVVGTLYRAASQVKAYTAYGKENRLLQEENQRLLRQLHDLRTQQRRDQLAADTLYTIVQDTTWTVQLGDSEQIEVSRSISTNYRVQAAQVVGATLHRANNLLTIDRGTADGVRPEMGVVGPTGVVGIVYLASAHYAIVIPLLNEDAQISCRLRGFNYFGTSVWRRGDPSVSYVTGIPRHATVRVGDVVETNGYSDIFPEGISVGRVEAVNDANDGMTYELTIRLSTDFSTLRNVSVLTGYQSTERKRLEAEAAEKEETR